MNVFRLDVEFKTSPCFAEPPYFLEMDSIKADRIFSWIALAWGTLFGETELSNLLKDFQSQNPPWIHSDLFPADDQSVYVPIRTRAESVSWRDAHRKSYIDIAQTATAFQVQNVESQSSAHTLVRMSTKGKPEGELSSKTLLPRLSPNTDAQNRYTCIFQLNPQHENEAQKLQSIFEYLKDTGFGAFRSVGAGQISKIRFEACTNSLPNLNKPSTETACQYLLLSTCCPTQSMLDSIRSSIEGTNSYSIQRSSGWIHSADGENTRIKKSHSSSFESGSVFCFPPSGMMLDLSKDGSTCYRYGLAMYMSLQ